VTITPADPGYQVQRLMDEIADLRAQVDILKRRLPVNAQPATVTAFSGGAMCTVQYTATGTTAPARYLYGYTPVVGHGGIVADFLANVFFIPVSAS